MKSKTIVIGLYAQRIDMLLCQGDRIISSKTIPAAFDPSPQHWGEEIRGMAKSIRGAAAEMCATGAPAIVLYHGPSDLAEYASQQFKDAEDAKQAAILACSESLGCPMDQAVCEAVVVGRDSSSAQPHTHVVVAADRDEMVCDIAEMVNSAGLRFVSAAPIDAIIMAAVAQQALQSKNEYSGRLYIGEQRSFFVICGSGSLLFARPISLGLDALVTSLTRPIRTPAGTSIELATDTAREILQTHGFAKRSQVVHEQHGLLAGHLLPLLQPVVQRFIVELRQSIRFGLPESRRQSVKIEVAGPGSTIPGFTEIIAAELQTEVAANAAGKSRLLEAGAPNSELADAIMHRRLLSALALHPRHIARVRSASKFRRWLLAGAGAALGLVAFDAMRMQAKVAETRIRAVQSSSSASDSKKLQATASKLFDRFKALDKLEATIATETAAQFDLRAYLHELSQITPKSVRLTNITFQQTDTIPSGTINGYALDEGGAGKSLEPFIKQLRGSPLFEDVVLVNVQLSSLGERKGQRFEARFTGIAAPKAAGAGLAQGQAAESKPPAPQGLAHETLSGGLAP